MLTRVTITGADDGVDPKHLAEMSAEYPFVEWGILFSRTRSGMARYPSAWWLIDQLCKNEDALKRMRLSAHLCGSLSRDTQAGILPVLDEVFQRYQLNGYDHLTEELIELSLREDRIEFILQCRSEETLQQVAHDAAKFGVGHASVLYDPSGGRGIEAFRWPLPPVGCHLGYAGGIRPDTIVDVLKDIGIVDSPFWVDMESGARTDDKFDLAKVRQALEAAKPFVVTQSDRPT